MKTFQNCFYIVIPAIFQYCISKTTSGMNFPCLKVDALTDGAVFVSIKPWSNVNINSVKNHLGRKCKYLILAIADSYFIFNKLIDYYIF